MRYLLVTLFVCAAPSCGESGEPMPDYMTVEKLALVYERSIGNELILEGRLNRDVRGNYFLTQLSVSPDTNHNDDFRVHLSFINGNLDHDLMKPCVGDATVVVGYIENAYTIRASRVKRSADSRIHKQVNCYHQYPW